MKYLGLLAFFLGLFSHSSLLFGSVGRNASDVDGDRYSCFVTAYVNQSVLFDTESQANALCRSLYSVFKVSTGCITRKFFTEEWEANFALKKIFEGIDSVDQYKEWALNHAHQGHIIKHTVFYSGKCIEEYPQLDLKF